MATMDSSSLIDFFRDLLVEAWTIVRRHLWLWPIALVVGLATGQAGGLGTLARPLLPSIDPILALTTYLETNDPIAALAQPGVVDVLSTLLRLSEMTLGELAPWLAALFGTTLFLLTVALVLDGTMIAAAARAHTGEPVTLGGALREGWSKAWRLFLIASVPATPVLVTMISLAIALGSFLTALNQGALTQEAATRATTITLVIAGGLLVPFGLVTLVFETLRHFANRSAVLEGTRFFNAYRRAWQVLRTRPAPFIVMLLIRVVVAGAVGTLLFLPGLFLLGVPIIWLVNSALKAYFATAWTVLWQDVSAEIALPT